MERAVFSLKQPQSVILPILRRYNAQNALLFGSYAKERADPGSDIDLLVYGGENFNPTDIFAIAEEQMGKSSSGVFSSSFRVLSIRFVQ
ncbi:MAG: nucleotidyltransferase domain-containing protein [Clostridiales Family XIII bacterium]|jgi:predicted nucleotidyltransferase|nr:nucleotidyltransferase domain-containing protein [Clostridiales Family XIII bacterium]